MRSSLREHGALLPCLTSTPLPGSAKRRLNPFLSAGVLSPICEPTHKKLRVFTENEDNKPYGKSAATSNLLRSTRRHSAQPGTLHHASTWMANKDSNIPPLVIARSDSEDDEQNFPTSVSKKKSKVSMRARSKQRPPSRNPRQSVLEDISENKKTVRRVSRADKILDEFMKESMRKSTHNINMKSDESIEAFVDKVMKNKDIDIKSPEPAAIQKPRKSRKSILKADKKILKTEKDIRLQEKENLEPLRRIIDRGEVEIFRKTMEPLKKNVDQKCPVNIEKNNKPRLPDQKCPVDIEKTNKPRLPEIFTSSDLDWHVVNGQNGVSMVRNPPVNYVKIGPKCKITNIGPLSKCELVIITEGNALVMLNGKTTKAGPGTNVLPSGSDFEILNTGVKKDLVLTCILV